MLTSSCLIRAGELSLGYVSEQNVQHTKMLLKKKSQFELMPLPTVCSKHKENGAHKNAKKRFSFIPC